MSANLQHLFERGFACQYHTAEAGLFEKLDARECGIVGLGAGVELDGRQVALQQTEILDDGGIGSGVVELVEQAHGIVYFVVK